MPQLDTENFFRKTLVKSIYRKNKTSKLESLDKKRFSTHALGKSFASYAECYNCFLNITGVAKVSKKKKERKKKIKSSISRLIDKTSSSLKFWKSSWIDWHRTKLKVPSFKNKHRFRQSIGLGNEKFFGKNVKRNPILWNRTINNKDL